MHVLEHVTHVNQNLINASYMKKVKDFIWKKEMSVSSLVDQFSTLGYQSIELHKAAQVIQKMKKEGAKIFISFTSNMVTSGLRGFFAQLIKLKMVDVIVTTAGSIEEDIMKTTDEDFGITNYNSDDAALYEKGDNRIGNLIINNKTYERFEDSFHSFLSKIYKKKPSLSVSELLKEIGSELNDENSILYQASKNNIPVFCPAITDSAIGFHLAFFRQKHKDFNIDIISDFSKLQSCSTHDEKKGIIALGGGVSKHHAILASLLSGGADYALYMTTAREFSGSVGGATTREAVSWGKIKDEADAVTVIGDVSINFPLAMCAALDSLSKEKVI